MRVVIFPSHGCAWGTGDVPCSLCCGVSDTVAVVLCSSAGQLQDYLSSRKMRDVRKRETVIEKQRKEGSGAGWHGCFLGLVVEPQTTPDYMLGPGSL